ncbi:MAG: AAA family ATPase, partial [Bacteroidota bacterium]
MSATEPTNAAYISHVHLKGYKSILDTEVELHPGLNVIIGPNGSGKTNFLEFLWRMTTRQLPKNDFNSHIEIKHSNGKEYNWEVQTSGRTIIDTRLNEQKIEVYEWIYSREVNRPKPKTKSYSRDRNDLYGDKQLAILLLELSPITKFSFDLPKPISGLDDYLSLTVNKSNLKTNIKATGATTFIRNFLNSSFYNKPFSNTNQLEKSNLLATIKIDSELIENLKKYSLIENVRIEEGLSVKENGVLYQINYLGFEFLVNGNWLNWNMLSDGTKRLFHLISEVTLNKGLCLVEEPEIGVHPNQYQRILTFLKEQSEEKQIIVTTHAPKTLDIFGDDELDRIILTSYDKNLGTKM